MWKEYKNILRAKIAFVLPVCVFVVVGLILSILYPRTILLLWVNDHHNAVLDSFFYFLTYFGDGIFFCGIILFFFLYDLSKGLTALWMLAIPSIVAQFLKRVMFSDVMRPVVVIPNQLLHQVHQTQLNELHSFPSGHAVISFTIALFFALYTKNVFFHFLLFTFAFLVAYSRMYLAQHFLIDISIGAFIAVFFGIFSFILAQKYNASILNFLKRNTKL